MRVEGGVCLYMGEGVNIDPHATFYLTTAVDRMSKPI